VPGTPKAQAVTRAHKKLYKKRSKIQAPKESNIHYTLLQLKFTEKILTYWSSFIICFENDNF
jgi:hypothetical protein